MMNGLLFFPTLGKVALFKAVINGDPAPTITWARNKGDTTDPEQYKPRYDERNREHVLEVNKTNINHLDLKFQDHIVKYIVMIDILV